MTALAITPIASKPVRSAILFILFTPFSKILIEETSYSMNCPQMSAQTGKLPRNVKDGGH